MIAEWVLRLEQENSDWANWKMQLFFEFLYDVTALVRLRLKIACEHVQHPCASGNIEYTSSLNACCYHKFMYKWGHNREHFATLVLYPQINFALMTCRSKNAALEKTEAQFALS